MGTRKGPTLKHALLLSLEELYKGCTKAVRVRLVRRLPYGYLR